MYELIDKSIDLSKFSWNSRRISCTSGLAYMTGGIPLIFIPRVKSGILLNNQELPSKCQKVPGIFTDNCFFFWRIHTYYPVMELV